MTAIHVTAGNRAGPRSQRGLEVYATPALAVESLLRLEPLPAEIWECCGDESSAIATVLRAHGRRVVCTDLATDGVDFRDWAMAPRGVQAIVTNPPFSLAADFATHGLALVPKVVVLERIQFLESETRAALFDAGKLARVWVFRKRLPRMHRSDWAGKRASAAMVLAWFVFDRDHDGPPALDWIRA
jgi:hypothetical protein